MAKQEIRPGVTDPVTHTQRRVHLVISGRVQGVGFRMAARDEAMRLGLTGWVGNLPNGSVETVAEGGANKLDRFVAWCRTGPPLARVRDLTVERGDAGGRFDSFVFRV